MAKYAARRGNGYNRDLNDENLHFHDIAVTDHLFFALIYNTTVRDSNSRVPEQHCRVDCNNTAMMARMTREEDVPAGGREEGRRAACRNYGSSSSAP